MRRIFLLIASSGWLGANAQVAGESLATVFPALTAYSNRFVDAFSTPNNAAALANVVRLSAGLYSERRFLLQELSSHLLSACLPTASGNFGMSAAHSGHSLHNTTSIGLAYSRKLADNLQFGARFSYQTQGAAGYGRSSAVGFGLGVLVNAGAGVKAGFSAENPASFSTGKNGEGKPPVVYAAGVGWDVSPQVFLAAQLKKTEDEGPTVQAGIQYAFAEKFCARAGLNTSRAIYNLGFGLQLRQLRLDVAASFHPYLGTTPGMALHFAKPK